MVVFKGIVIQGKKRGNLLGFPTANIPLPFSIPEGIYVSSVVLEEKTYHGLTFIGAAKTFNEVKAQTETWILDFECDIYGKELEISLLEKIRENMKFNSEEELIKQMEKDKKDAILYFSHENK